LLAKVVNDDAGSLTPRGVLGFFASKLAPAGGASGGFAGNKKPDIHHRAEVGQAGRKCFIALILRRVFTQRVEKILQSPASVAR
jgi:hypothetical protein